MTTALSPDLYEQDFYAWTQEQAEGLRLLAESRPNLPLDLAHIAEEIQDLGKSEYEAAFRLMQRTIEHLLLIQHSPATDQRRHWADEIDEVRDQIDRKLSPTIRNRLRREFEEGFTRARQRVARKMKRYDEGQAAEALPDECPYTIEQILGDWEPDEITSST